MHEDYICIDELNLLNKEEMKQRSMNEKKEVLNL